MSEEKTSSALDDLSPPARHALLDDLKGRHLAFAVEKLTGGEAKALLRSNVASFVNEWLRAKVEDVVNVDAAIRAIEASLTDATLRKTMRPAVKTLLLLEVARLREDIEPLGTYVPDEARAKIRELLERPGIIPAKLVREIATHEAAEGVMREVLNTAIKDFQEKVNPFTSEWGLPGFLKKMGPLGAGLAKSLESVQGEFEKRVEPELKRFLAGAAKRAMNMTANFVVDRSDEPAFVQLRKQLFNWFLEQPLNEVAGMDEINVRLSEDAAFEIFRHVSSMPAAKKRRRALVEMMFSAHRQQTVQEALATYGIQPELDVDAITGAVFPLLQSWVKGPAGQTFLAELITDFYDHLAA